MTRPLNHTGVRRAVGLLATPALALATIAALPAAPSYAAEADPIPVAAGAAWLESQLTDGLVHNDQYGFDDLGLSVDVALGLDAVGGHDAAVQEITDAVAANVETYTSYQAGATPDTTHVLAGSLAKALALATSTGRDGTAFGGKDLVAELEAQVAIEAPIAGRIQDTYDATLPFESDYANTIGQAFAVQGLDAEDSTLVDPVTDFLLAQQCSDGYFRLNFAAADAAEQSCDADPEAAPDTDVTALAVIALQSQTDDTDVQTAVTKATGWLADAQRADGSFGGGTTTEAPNANSTGLAGWALGVEGDTVSAAQAAVWVRGVQADDPEPCTTGLTGELGAIAYDGPSHGLGRSQGIVTETQDQWRRSTAQALPVLQWAPATGTGPIAKVTDNGFRRAGTSVRVVADGNAPGDTVCVARAGKLAGLLTAGDNGQAVGRVVLPAGTAKRTYLLNNNESELSMFTFHALGAKKLGLGLSKRRIARGQVERVKVAKLAAGERVKVKFRGKVVRAGRANKRGVFVTSFKVTGKPGLAGVRVVGQFVNRANAKTLTVTR
ncbi:MAG: terpene cyclase/mutase family protein [Nocardioides sp.]|nr:terpene cyclase/mutase family protein [Nocardioides sp.]